MIMAMAVVSEKEPRIRMRGSYSFFTIIEQLSHLVSHPSKFSSERKGYEELSRLMMPLIIMALLMSLVLVPTIAYMQVRQDVASKYYEALGESEYFPSENVDEMAANREISLITRNTIRYMIAEHWAIIILLGLLVVPLYAIILLIFFLLRALLRYAYLMLWKGKGSLQRHLTLEAYYALLWNPIGIMVLLLAMALSGTESAFGSLMLLFLIVVLTLWNWHVYISSMGEMHSMKKAKAFIVLFLPVVLSLVFLMAFYIVIVAMTAKILLAISA